MRVLLVSRYKANFASHILPFVEEQGSALKKEGITVDYYLVKGSYFNIKPLKQKISMFHPDIIHAHYGLSAITAELQNSVPVVTTFHNGEVSSLPINILCSLFSLRAKHCIYVARHIYDKCIFKRKIHYSIIPCGVSLDDCKITAKEEARAKLGFDPLKKYILFGGAFDNLRKNYPLLQDAVRITGRNDIECLEIKGFSREDVCLRMCACDLFALPSKSEGSPQALKEAMACNCPIIATNVADIKHLMGKLSGHYICSFKPTEVANTIQSALLFEERTEGRKRIVELGLTNDLIAKKLIDIYNSVLGDALSNR